MANEITQDTVLAKKLEGYDRGKDNFIAPGEATLTITLNEYRKLVTISATTTSQIDAANKDKYNREAENKALKEENAALKAELYELKKKLDGDTENNEEDKNI